MRKYISITFLAIFLLSTNAQLLELTKLPVFIEHFQEHKHWDPKISFSDFVYMHYFDENNAYGDVDRDKEMPFKTITHSFSTLVAFMQPSRVLQQSCSPIQNEIGVKKLALSSAYISTYLSSIWQPPRFC